MGSARMPSTASPAAASVARELRPGGVWFTKAEPQQRLDGRQRRLQVEPRRPRRHQAEVGRAHGLAVIAGDRNSPQKHVWRAEIVLLTADGIGTVEIMRRTGKSKASTSP